MSKNSEQSIITFADKLIEVEKSLSDFYDNNINTLTQSEKNELIKTRKTLVKDADNLYTFAALFMVAEIVVELDKVNAITKKINETIKQLNNIQKAIEIAALLVKLSTAVVMKDISSAKEATTALIEQF